jgi:hypothetical protein
MITVDITLPVNGHLAQLDLALEKMVPVHVSIPVSRSDDLVLVGTELGVDMNGVQEFATRRLSGIFIFQLIKSTWEKS